MNEVNLYDAIFKRKSVRKFDPAPLDDKTLAGISARLSELQPLYDDIKTEIKLVSQKNIRTPLFKAPHYLVVFSEVKEGYLTNAGFMLQQMDLYLSAQGIGSCWQGLPRLDSELLNGSKLEFIIVLAIGKSLEPLYRQNITEFKRYPLQQITNITGADELLEPARLAPSGINSQPWFFTGEIGLIHAYCIKTNFLKAIIYETMNKIDMGITICHVWIAALHFGKTVEFISDEEARNHPPAKHYYITSLKIR